MFVAESLSELAEKPYNIFCTPEKKAPVKRRKLTSKKKVKCNQSASFKRRAGVNRPLKLSPMAKQLHAKLTHASDKARDALDRDEVKDASDNPGVADEIKDDSADPVDPHKQELKAYKDFLSALQKLEVPPELFPEACPRGSKSYTVRHPTSKASVQVLHSKQAFFATADADGETPALQTWTWSAHGGIKFCWNALKTFIRWE